MQKCLLLQDDIHLPLGKCGAARVGAMEGTKGVRSVLTDSQTNDFRRLEIGVPTDPGRHFEGRLPGRTVLSREAMAINSAVKAAFDQIIPIFDGFTSHV